MKHEAEFKEYVEKVKERLAYGEDKYGDRIEKIPSQTVIDEIEAEFLDIVGWGFEIWRRMQVFRVKLEKWENDSTV
jgi:hypothetical protein